MVNSWTREPAKAARIPGFYPSVIVLLFIIGLIFNHRTIYAQSLPIGAWESHFNYHSARYVAESADKIYVASFNGFFSISKTGKDLQKLGKEDGFSETGIVSLSWDSDPNTLIVAYRTGNMDIVDLNDASEPETISSWKLFESTTDLPLTKTINKILLRNGYTYLATNFGVVVLNVHNREVLETYRYIGKDGAQADVKDIAIMQDSIYVLTTQGLQVSATDVSINKQYFANWKQRSSPGNIKAILSDSGILYAGIAGKGIYTLSNNSWKLIHPTASTSYAFTKSDGKIVTTTDNSIVTISGGTEISILSNPLILSPKLTIFDSMDNFWIADGKNGLIGNVGNAFKSYSPANTDTTIAPRPDSVVVDQYGLSWKRLPAYLGGGILVKDPVSNRERLLTTATGNGGLPSNTINSLTTDEDGYIWFASDRGVGYLSVEDILQNNSVNAVLPVYGQRRLFSNEKCTAIATEAGNRKWIGTQNGLYLFNSDGTELVSYFNAENSPLPSDQIHVLRFESATGQLFIDTPLGMVSHQTQSIAPSENLTDISIFPNPVRPGFSGNVGIKGLPSQSIVKITQLSGRLVYETRSEGGLATWALNDYNGKRAASGIYFVFIVSSDGNQKLAGKLAIID
jgi:hypothetical protein